MRFVPVTDSTNTDLVELAATGAPEWTVLVAGHQRNGRGRLSRSWQEPPDSSLLVSVLLHPDGEPAHAALISLAAVVAMVDALSSTCEVDARCKWPNDVMAGGRKLGGILAEAKVEGSRLANLVVGAGVNVLQRGEDLPDPARASATSVIMQGGRPDGPALLAAYLRGFGELYGFARHGTARFAEEVLPRYRARCETLGLRVRAVTADGRAIEGLATAIGAGGELVIEENGGGSSSVTFGEVVHLRPSPAG